MRRLLFSMAVVLLAGCAAPTTQRVQVSAAQTASEAQKQQDLSSKSTSQIGLGCSGFTGKLPVAQSIYVPRPRAVSVSM